MFSTLASILFVLSTPQPSFTASAPSNPGEAGQTIVAYVAARQADDIVRYVEAVDAWEAAQRAYSPPTGPAVTAPQTLNTGAHSDAWWHGVSICEQSGLNDPYFGYFSIMDGSAGGLDWSTQVAMANGIISRYGDSAWAQSCVDAGYAASPGG